MKTDVAVVAEGGGQRGIFTAGVLDAFLDYQFNPFDLGCGVSAGAQNLLTYFLEQPGYARRAIIELTARPDFLVPYRWLTAQSVLDLDGYFETTRRDPEFRLPFQRLDAVSRRRRLQFVATDKETLEPIYLEPDESTVLEYLKASSAVPFLYRSGVPFGGGLLVDGGVADPLPVQHVYAQGVRRLLVIRTVPMPDTTLPDRDDADDESLWRQRLLQVRRLTGMTGTIPARVMSMLTRHEQALARATRFLRNPPADLDLCVIAPLTPLRSQVFGSRSDALLADYRLAWEIGTRAVDTLKSWREPIQDRAAMQDDPGLLS